MVLSPVFKKENASGIEDWFESDLDRSMIDDPSLPNGAAFADVQRKRMIISTPHHIPFSAQLLMVLDISFQMSLQVVIIFFEIYLLVLFTLIFFRWFSLLTGADVMLLVLFDN